MTTDDKYASAVAAVIVTGVIGLVFTCSMAVRGVKTEKTTESRTTRQATRLCVPMPVVDFYDCEYRARMMLEAGYSEKQVWEDLYDAESLPEEVTL